MWKLIESYSTIAQMGVGDIITNNPDNPEEIYEIKSIQDGYIKAMHADEKIAMVLLLQIHLMKDKWWVKERK